MKIVRTIYSLLVVLAFVAPARAVPIETLQLTEPRAWTNDAGDVFLYRWHAPARIEPGKRYPFVFLMHGAGERGTNNISQLQWGAKEVLTYAIKSGDDCFFLAGQVPNGHRWVERNWSETHHRAPAEPSRTMALQIELAARLFAELPVDRDRIYATGISMGGYGTWDLISRRPEWFAAAMPVCGGMDLQQAWRLRDIALLIHHGDRDHVVPFVRSRLATEALWKAGGNVKYTEYAGWGHNVWTPAYGTEANLKTLFSQRKVHRPRIPFASGDKIAFLGDSITEHGTKNANGYVNLVMAGLKAKGIEAELVPAGVSGNMSNHMLARLERDVLAKRPRWMFLSCGVNDAPNGYEDARKNPGLPLETYRKNMTEIITRAQAANIGVILLEPTPVVEEPHLANVNEAPYVEVVRALARQFKLPLVPLNTVFSGYNATKENPFLRELTVDGTHLNTLGNRIFAETVLSTLGF